MAGNETIFVDDGEIMDLISETAAVVNEVYYIIGAEEFEKKKNIHFVELDKDLSSWKKHIKEYDNKVCLYNKLEEGMKQKLLNRLEISELEKDIKSFKSLLIKVQRLLNNHIKITCSDLIFHDEIKKTAKLEETIDQMKDYIEELKDMEESIKNHDKVKLTRRNMQYATKMLKIFNEIKEDVSATQKRAIQHILDKLKNT